MHMIRAVIRHRITDVIITGALPDGRVLVDHLMVGMHARQEIVRLGKAAPLNPSALDGVVAGIVAYLDGKIIDLSIIPLESGRVTEFRRSVLVAARRIPYGTTCTYSELAKMAGYPAAVRAVASVMRRNTIPLLIPCHRVIRSDGTIGGFCGSQAGEDVLLKRRLPEMEARNRSGR